MAANKNHFDLTLDTLAPTGSITIPSEFMKENGNLSLSYSDGDGVGTQFMKVWFNENAEGTKADTTYPTAWEAVAGTKTTAFSIDGEYYYHVVFMDTVNNESEVYNTAKITYDTTKPTVSDVFMEDPDGEESVKRSITNQANVDFGFTFADNLSGAVKATVSGDFTGSPRDIAISGTSGTYDKTATGYSQLSLTKEDQDNTITVTITDAAGNESTAGTATIFYDKSITKPVIVLQDKATTPAALGGYINYHDINVLITSNDSDIVAYKVWENGTDEPDWTTQTKGTLSATVALTLSAGDGLKTVHGKVKDSAGNVSAADDKTVTIDTVVPVVTITSVTPLMISNVEGYKSAVVTYSVSDATAGIKAWEIRVNGTKATEGTSEVSGGTFTITSATSGMVEGSNTISLWAVDNATTSPSGSLNENSTTYADSLVLDVTAPTASIGQMNTWYKEKPGYTLTYSDAGVGVETIYAWTSTVADDQTVPSTASAITPTTSPQTIAAGNIDGTPAESAANYMHAKVVDKVGNVVYSHAVYGFDSVAPTAVTAAFVKAYYNTTSAEINVTAYTDATSGVKAYKLTGNITACGGTTPGTWFDVSGTLPEVINVTLSENASLKTVETKKVQIFLKDTAGNESAQLLEISTELDQEDPVATLVLRKADDSDAQPARVNVQPFAARISGTDDTQTGTAVEYKLWGDFNSDGGSTGTTEPENWSTLTYESGQTYMLITGLKCTSGDGTKNVNLKVRDNAGNVSPLATQSFYYDTTPPTVEVSDIDYQQISKVHELRLSGTTPAPVADKYADEMHFSFAPDSTCQAFKCCAYLTQEAAAGGSAADTAIPTTAGSTNMSGTGTYAASVKINSMLKGADFETALGGVEKAGDKDGTHYVVVYVQDEGGNWSGAAVFNVIF